MAVNANERREIYHAEITHPDEHLPDVMVKITWESGKNKLQEIRNYPSVQQLGAAINKEKLVRSVEFTAGFAAAIAGVSLTTFVFPAITPELAVELIGRVDLTTPSRIVGGITGISSVIGGTFAAVDAITGFQKLGAIRSKIPSAFLRVFPTSPAIQPQS